MDVNDRPVVTKNGHEPRNTAQSGGLLLMTGVGPQHTPATKLWFGKTSNAPGFRSLPHHHGEAETGAYVLSGRARVDSGKDYQNYSDLSEGDFMFVPPFIPHPKVNMSTTEELWWPAVVRRRTSWSTSPTSRIFRLRATAGPETAPRRERMPRRYFRSAATCILRILSGSDGGSPL